MRVITSSQDMQQYALEQKAKGLTIGYVPTMGYLHEGHLGLMKQAKEKTAINVVSVFVNPTQFGPNEDFETYPRDYERDLELVQEAGMDVLFYPSVDEIYSDLDLIQLTVTDRTEALCGASRPGHFDGVVTVLTKLFNVVQPTKAYFGMKDAQQVAVVEGLIQTFKMPIQIERVQTVREPDGLAKSSRNVKLNASEREEAPMIYESLKWGRALMKEQGMTPEEAVERTRERLTSQLKCGRLDYLACLRYPELTAFTGTGEAILAVAVFYEKARLIDNLIFTLQED